MNIKFIFFLFLPMTLQAQKSYTPIAKKNAKELTIHNHTRIDNYFWMNERDSKDVLNYIKAENKVSKGFFKSNQKLISKLITEFNGRINPNDVYPPFEVNGISYQETISEKDDYTKTWILNGTDKKLFIDENKRAKKHSFYELANWVPSPNNQLVAICEDFIGRRNYEITFRNYSNDTFLEDKLEQTDGLIEWANDNKTVFYIKKDPQTLRSFQVYRHVLGTNQATDDLIYEEKDEKFEIGIEKSTNSQYIFIVSQSSTTTEYWYLDANKSQTMPNVFLKREQNHEYKVQAHNNGFYLLTNKNAPNRKIVFSKTIPTSIETCNEVIAHDESRLIEELIVTDSHIFAQERSNGLEQIRLYDITTKASQYIEVEEETRSLQIIDNDNYYSKTVDFSYNSMTTPTTIFRQDLSSGNRTIIYQYELLDKQFKPSDYESKRIWATATDGTKIPVSIVYKKGTDLASSPCFLYGYGSYGVTIPDVFSATRLSLLNRGFVYALAHVRGEKYLGDQWYQDGKYLKKKNTFTDFINTAEFLGNEGYCDPSKIYINGGSAGGLLIGAVLNMAPHLFKGAIADVPFVDVVTTMLDETVPLTVGEYEEWGNPNEQEYYQYMLSYSPYDNVPKADFPHLLITTGYHDSQVQYWEPLKWIAKIRDYRTNNNLLLLDCNMDSGHGGGSGRSSARMELAKMFTFILNLEGEN
ncbi:MAG: S9 family peptidase [Crocinitomicaceae bacterium]|nr:S9 family peptidase [Crocinitomicaceae bacterium]